MMPRRTHRLGRALAAALAFGGTLMVIGSPAEAEPPASQVVAIYDADRCASDVCANGDPTIAEGAAVTGPIQVHVRSEATFGLEWVRLQAHVEGTPPTLWICLQQWRQGPGTLSFDGRYTWNTAVWPDPATPESDCEHQTRHYHSEATKNARYTLRAIARERSPDREIETDSPGFDIRLTNRPVPPSWAVEPSVSGGASPAVTLRWKANPEERTQPSPDLIEYHFVRVGPDGDEKEFAVNAARPTDQGCQRLSSLYQCTDRSFTASGRYRYALIAFRNGAGAGVPCATTTGTCIESRLSKVAAAEVTVAAPGSAPPTADGSVSPSALPTTTGTPTTPTAPVEVEPPIDRSEQLAAADRDDESATESAVPIAAGLVLLLVAAHVIRTLRISR